MCTMERYLVGKLEGEARLEEVVLNMLSIKYYWSRVI